MPHTSSAKLMIVNKYGMHARPATNLAALAEPFKCDVLVRLGDVDADGKSIMELMMLAATKGSEVEIVCTGDDADECLRVLSDLIGRGFDEED